MIKTETPTNWVALRAKCHVDLVFMALRDVVARDVEEINRVDSRKRHGFTFALQNGPSSSVPRFGVIRTHTHYQGTVSTVLFTQSSTDIVVDLSDNSKFKVIAEWHEDEGVCRLTVDGDIFEPWQVSQKALTRFFFDG